MASKSARKGKLKEEKASSYNTDALANFTLPTSLPCSEVDFPVLIKKRYKANWKAILAESEKEMHEIEQYVATKKPPVHKSPFQKTEMDFIKDKVFKTLLPALEETLIKAKTWDVFVKQKCFFNGIDHIVQCLWNNNPRHPNRSAQNPNLHVFNMPWVREWLKDHPRPIYPKSWLWTENYAATVIQKSVRQYFVQREEEVQELRGFWRKLDLEKDMEEIIENPLLAKKFASQAAIRFQPKDKPQNYSK